MATSKQLLDSSKARLTKHQHVRPCSDCPWRRDSLPGWLGGNTPEQWRQWAHGETRVDCHVFINQQCAGLAIYRANVCKSVRDASILKLPGDKESVFGTPAEFINHHTRKNT